MNKHEAFEKIHRAQQVTTNLPAHQRYIKLEDGFYAQWDVEIAWRCYQARMLRAAKLCRETKSLRDLGSTILGTDRCIEVIEQEVSDE